MIRLVVEVIDANDHCHIDGPIRKYYRTVDIEHPELEQLLKGNPNAFTTGTVIGAEILLRSGDGD